MRKLAYDDLYKFLVSIGLAFVSLSLLIPYLYLKEDFNLYVDPTKVQTLAIPVQDLIKTKQDYVIYLLGIIPPLSIILFFLGCSFSIFGLSKWIKQQKKLNKRFDRESTKLELEIQTLSPNEAIDKAENELIEIRSSEEAENNSTEISPTNNQALRRYLGVEDKIIKNFLERDSRDFEVRAHQRIGKKFEVDMLLISQTKEKSDRVIEIKYFNRHLSTSLIRTVSDRFVPCITYYQGITNKSVIPILLIVYNADTITETQITTVTDKINEYIFGRPILENLILKFIPDNELENLSVDQFLK